MDRSLSRAGVFVAALATSGCFAHTPAIRGPGSAEMPVAWRCNRSLAEHFVMVTWDQRGAGKSNHGGFDERTTTLERFMQDAHASSGAGSGEDADPEPQPHPPPRTERVILPFLFYTPETKLAGGAMVAGYRRLEPELPPSSVLAAATVTVRRQFALDGDSKLQLPGGRRLEGSFRLQHYPDRFFGVGPGTPDEAEEAYTSRMVRAQLRAQHEVRPALRVGPQALFRWEDVADVEEGGALAAGTLTASGGGRWLGLGVLATRDTRDDLFSPRRGTYVELSAVRFPDALGTTGYHRGVGDVRWFLPVGGRSTIGARAWLEAAAGEVPVLVLPALGGRERLRGYFEGRLRDRVAATAQAELRFPVFWRFSGVVFGEAGQVAPRFSGLWDGGPEASAGAGLRFRMAQDGSRIRLDYAVGRRGSGLYITIGEAF